MILKLALKEILYHKRFSLLFMINISLGLLGLILVENFKYSFQDVLDARSKKLLGADLAVRSRYQLSPERLDGFYQLVRKKSLSGRIEHTSQISLFSMMSVNNSEPRLVSLYTLNGRFPFYGNLTLNNTEKRYPVEREEPDLFKVWVYREALGRFDDQQVKSLSVGGERFSLDGIVTLDDQQAFSTSALAPKVFISLETLKRTNLIQKGSTVTYSYYVKAPLAIDSNFLKQLNDYFDDNSISVLTPEKTSMQVGRVFAYLSDFLGLVSMIALFLASLGLFYLFRSAMQEKRLVFATFNAIGLDPKTIKKTYWLYSLLLIFMATTVALLCAQLFVPLIAYFFKDLLGVQLSSQLHGKAALVTYLVGLGGTILLVFPILTIILNEKLSSLFQEVSQKSGTFSRYHLTLFVPYLLFFTMMSLYLANSYKIAFWFMTMLAVVVLVLYPLSSFFLSFIYRRSENFNLISKLSTRYLYRFKVATISIFICLSLCSVLLNILPQIELSLNKELSFDNDDDKPQFFLFDIQDEQVDPLVQFIKDKNYRLIALSPMIRARLAKINGKDVSVPSEKATTREEERAQRFRNRGVNLGYRRTPLASEKVVEGVMPDDDFVDDGKQLPQISLEIRYAKRLGVGIGDQLTFNIMGVEQEALVTSIRTVKWTSFVPNFFIQFQPGVLENAPKTWLAAINPLVKSDTGPSIRLDLFERFANVSAVNIEQVIDKVFVVMEQVAFVLKVMSVLCLLVGLLVLYSLVSHQLQQRKKDLQLLNIIGLSSKSLSSMIQREFLTLVLLSSLVGGSFGVVVSYLLSFLFFDATWSGSFMVPVWLTICCLTLSFFIILWTSRRLLTR